MQTSLIVDAAVVAIYFAVIIGIGLRAGRGSNNLQEFTLGGHSIPWWAVLASIIAAETSAATFLGAPAEGFKTRSFAYAQLAIGTVIARFIIAYLFIAPYYRHKVQSIYEFLDIRFGPATRNMASAIFLVTRVLGIGVRLYLGGVIIVVIWRYLYPGVPVTLGTYFWGIFFTTVVTTIYTAVGGIKAVVWTDLIQACLMIGAIFFAMGAIFFSIPGGWQTVSASLAANPGAGMIQTGWDSSKPFFEALKGMLETPYTIFAAIIGSTLFTMATHGTDQDMVQRLLTAENQAKAKRSLIVSGFADIPIVLGFLSIGLLLAIHYEVSPDPSLPAQHNEVFAYYIVNEMPVVIRGLIVAGVFATMMGSTSAALNALATSFTKDFYIPYLGGATATDAKAVAVARTATAVFGALMVGVATAAAYAVLQTNITIIPLALGILGYSYGSLLGVFLLGMLTSTRGNDRANVAAMLAGIIAVLVFCKVKIPALDLGALLRGELVPQEWMFGAILPAWWPVIAWPYYVLIGTSATIGIAVLFKTPERRDVPPDSVLSR
ncbi:MAG: sodium:solute symporter [Chthoniobacterales bacterium]|nr:sodium:solute symporter [Chthoniobacterales bacterium]